MCGSLSQHDKALGKFVEEVYFSRMGLYRHKCGTLGQPTKGLSRFDRKAFSMITGLNYGKLTPSSKMRNLSYDLWTKYFGHSGLITQVEFTKAFETIEFKYENKKEISDNIKCCMLYLLKMVLLPEMKIPYMVNLWIWPDDKRYTDLLVVVAEACLSVALELEPEPVHTIIGILQYPSDKAIMRGSYTKFVQIDTDVIEAMKQYEHHID
ncbi:hypothetical protein FNV43_RR07393 [Rhamnella rubrinervis]|uniref:Uncharacterized protein n=1 Tax=Rhamnella rubrinervis TaxID=2594499 RepID=A0A8K0MMN8_9ROSA|nr:hypothetical protein FNV43_RR07393 [Rhamnella rubrinervis]